MVLMDWSEKHRSCAVCWWPRDGNGLAKKKPDVAGKLIMEQFPDLACVEVRAGSISTKVLR